MAIRKFTNETTHDVTISDLGIVISPGEVKDLAEIYNLSELANADSLIELLSSQQLSLDIGDGTLSVARAIDIIRRTELKSTQLDSTGKWRVRADSRPLAESGAPYETVFTMIGDDTDIANGTPIYWDFSNNADLVDAPTGYKRKRIEVRFLEPVYLKDGAMYFTDVLKGSYLDLFVVCPAGQYYLKNDGSPALATQDTPVRHFLMHHFFSGTVNMGDEQNAEGAAEDPVPTNYVIWLEVTVPAGDNSSFGWGELEMYREKTMIL